MYHKTPGDSARGSKLVLKSLLEFALKFVFDEERSGERSYTSNCI